MSSNIPTNALVVVADGGKAILFRNTGKGLQITLREEQRLGHAEIAQGPSGSRPEDQSPKETDEATFAKGVAQTLEAMHGKGQFEALVLVADPQTLGQLRDALHKTVANSVTHSLPKDLTNHGTAEIEAALSK
ncbi:host attachment family protein [Roseomonas sp. NAR14]|uniref:Host attachment family protein n=1 Tax=Roseomonas acroporae TaxID=2937791 RepID=A0A9X1YHC4_9PROT|nr:host attachment family protein [Roseomonas acroporae]MCK8786166.1 host attachment family protein [Roseomonas acroporae]